MVGGEFQRRLRRVEQIVLGLPRVTGVGVGWKETARAVTGTMAWRVYVDRKLPPAVLGPGAIVPAAIEGLATDVVPALSGVAIAAVAPTLPPPVAPGITISNLRGLFNDGPVDRNAS